MPNFVCQVRAAVVRVVRPDTPLRGINIYEWRPASGVVSWSGEVGVSKVDCRGDPHRRYSESIGYLNCIYGVKD